MKNLARLLILVTTMCCILTFAVTINAQEVDSKQQTANSQTQTPALPASTTKEALPDGSYIVAINGKRLKAMDPATLRDILKTNEDADKAIRARAALEKQIAIYEDNLLAMRRLVEVADAQRADEIGIAGDYKTLYVGEHDLRLKAEKLYAPPGKVSGFFQNPVVQIAEKIAKPILENWINSRRRTTVVMTYDQVAVLRTQQIGGRQPTHGRASIRPASCLSQ